MSGIATGGGSAALRAAASIGDVALCQRYLGPARCVRFSRDEEGRSALHLAASGGHSAVVRLLLNIAAPREVDSPDGAGCTALQRAAADGHEEVLRLLLARGADVDKQDNVVYRGMSKCEMRCECCGSQSRPASTVKGVDDNLDRSRHWSPYGCHYYPDPEAFPSPRLDSLPQEPLKRGEQYYLDLAGNICKGPVGVGYTCYCAPLFRHLEARMEKEKRELQRAQVRLGQRVAGLEQKLNRGRLERRSDRVLAMTKRESLCPLPRSRSLEMLDKIDKPLIQSTRSMDELDPSEELDEQRPSVKELVARIQQQTRSSNNGNNSESSDEEDSPLRITQQQGTMGESNMVSAPLSMPNYENVPNDAPPRSRSGVYSPTIVNTTLIDSNTRYIEPIIKIEESNIRYSETLIKYNQPSTSKHDPRFQPEIRHVEPSYKVQCYENEVSSPNKYYDHNLSTRLTKLRVLDNAKVYTGKCSLEGTSRMLDTNYEGTHVQDTVDRDTNNDSGYSTKVYGSSKGNSPSLSGQIDECIGGASLV